MFAALAADILVKAGNMEQMIPGSQGRWYTAGQIADAILGMTGVVARVPVYVAGRITDTLTIRPANEMAVAPVKVKRKSRTKKPVGLFPIKPGDGVIETVEGVGRPLTVPELAGVTWISNGAIYAAIRNGKLVADGAGGTYRLCPKEAARWLRSNRTVQEPCNGTPKSKPKKKP